MRQATVDCKTKKQAEKECPWAEKIVKVDGGYKDGKRQAAYKCFESYQDYLLWKGQK